MGCLQTPPRALASSTSSPAPLHADMDADRIDAATEAAWVAAVEKLEADKAAEKIATEKTFCVAESTRLASVCGIKPEEKSNWVRLKPKNGKVMLMLKQAKPNRSKTGQFKASKTIPRTRLRQASLLDMQKKKEKSQQIKARREKRIAHHANYLEKKLVQEKEARTARLAQTPGEFAESEKNRIATEEKMRLNWRA